MGNPYQSFGEEPAYGSGATGGLQYIRAYEALFDNPNWPLTLLIGTVAQFVPIVGPMAFMGYLFEVVASLVENPKEVYPEFDFNRLVDYLQRGLWPFLVALVVSLVVTPVLMLLFFVPMILLGIAAENNNELGAVLSFGMMAVWMVGIFVVSFGMHVVMMPMLLAAGLEQDFSAGFRFGFVMDFLRLMWVDVLLEMLFLMVSSIVVSMLGLLLLCVGIYPAATWVWFASFHLMFQLYTIYLARGGMPLQIQGDAKKIF